MTMEKVRNKITIELNLSSHILSSYSLIGDINLLR